MDKIKKIKIEYEDGLLSDEIPFEIDAENINITERENLLARLNLIDEKFSSINEKNLELEEMIEINKDSIENLSTKSINMDIKIEDNKSSIDLLTDEDKNINEKIKDLHGNIENLNNVEYLFPNRTFETSEYNLIRGYNKTILIDTGNFKETENFRNFLINNKVEHIDYLIVTHFHGDHSGNLIMLYEENYADNNTKLFLPTFNTEVWKDNSAYSQYIPIKEYIENHNINYVNPVEGMKVSVAENFSFTIYNTNDTYYINNGISTDYNNASLVTLIKHYNVNSLYTGDCFKHALKKIYADKVLPNTIHIYKMGHHGNDSSVNAITQFIEYFNIIHAVQIVGINDVELNKCSASGTATNITMQTDNIYCTCYNEDYIKFNSIRNNISLVNGLKTTTCTLGFTSLNIYVDCENRQDIQNGSSNYPFGNLPQAIGYISRNNGCNYIIHVANGIYKSHIYDSQYRATLNNCGNRIEIIGESKENTILNYGFLIYNCQYIKISNLTIENNIPSRGIRIYTSNVFIDNIDYKMKSGLDYQFAISLEDNSYLSISNSHISECVYGIHTTNSTIDASNIKFEKCSQSCIYAINGTINFIRGVKILDNSVFYNRKADSEPNIKEGIELFKGNWNYSSEQNQIQLFENPLKYSKIEVLFYVNGQSITKTFYLYGEKDYGTSHIFISSNQLQMYSYMFVLRIVNNNIITIPYSRRVITDFTNNTNTLEEDVSNYTIQKIICY